MSRRKQARPSRANLEEDPVHGPLIRCNPLSSIEDQPTTLQDDNDTGSEGEDSSGGGIVGEEAVDLTSNRSHQEDEDEREPEELPMEEDDEEAIDDNDEQDDDEEGSRKQMRNRQDAENNNSFIENATSSGMFATPAGTSHVTLEALQNTKVAVAQYAATALAGGADSEAALQDLALLQNTLYTLQHQQVFQLQLISQLQQQLSITHTQGSSGSQTMLPGENMTESKEGSTTVSPAPTPLLHPKPLSSLTSPPSSRPSSHQPSSSPLPVTTTILTQERPIASSSASPISLTLASSSGIITPVPTTSTNANTIITNSSSVSSTTNSVQTNTHSHQMPPLCSISSSFASSIITNNDPLPLHEPNTLEMLQKRAQEVLDNASQGLLANNLADELAFRSGKSGSRLSPYDSKSAGGRGEPFFKHRCRYCGKVFGSDSALQIHIRSHTGERPFKCNVCGSRFTTKGNLKVHFQRHTAKFPHVKMNPNPVPEHLDKYHPPLLQQLAASGQRPLPSPPPPSAPPTAPVTVPSPHHASFHPAAAHGFLPPQPPLPLSLALPAAAAAAAAAAAGMPNLYHRGPIVSHRDDQDIPENLSKSINIPTPPISISTATTTMITTTSASTTTETSPISLMHSPKSPLMTMTTTTSNAIHSNSHHSCNENNQRDDIKREQNSPLVHRPISRGPDETIMPKREPEEHQSIDDMPDDDIDDFEPSSSPPSPPTSRHCERYIDHGSPTAIINNQVMAHAQSYEDCSMDSKMSGRLETDGGDMNGDEEMEEQPENLSGRGTNSRLCQQPINYNPGASPASSTASSGSLQTSFAGLLFPAAPPTTHQQQQLSNIPSSNAPTTGTNTNETMIVDPARDPAIYSSLLPRPGSNDNSWESLIEITKTSETTKLQQLVDNIEHKLTDPNQCIICHRVLSCKSALQMHYRTHTGERPFKCKICGRAFTTKGNLKTHMGVHRAKPPLRVLHQCPVCHKKFTNALVLQQHIRLHTGEPTDLSPEQIQAAEVNDFPPGYPPHPLASFLPQGFPPLHPGAGFPLGFPPSRLPPLERPIQDNDMDIKDSHIAHQHRLYQQHQHQLQQHRRYLDEQSEDMEDQEDEEDEDRRDDDERCAEDLRDHRNVTDLDDEQENDREDIKDNSSSMACFSTSLAALENQVRTITTMPSGENLITPSDATSPMLDRYNCTEKSTSPPGSVLGTPLDLTPRASSTPGSIVSESTPPPPPPPPLPPPPTLQHHSHPFGMFAGLLQAVSSSPSSSVNSIQSTTGGITNVASINAVSPGGGGGNGSNGGALASLTTSAVLAASSTYNPLGLAVGGPAVRGNTTCNICYKTFACNSALEIHYRSHTKERPFKCTICDRGFSTKNDGTVIRECICLDPRDVLITQGPPALKPKRRRRRTEEQKTRGRSGGGGGWALTSGSAAIHLPPLMPPALGLLASDHVFLGNMKQHMLTHKIRDMPQHLFNDGKQQQSALQTTQQHQQTPPQQQQTQQPPIQQQLQQQHIPDHENSRSPMCTDDSSLPTPPPPPPPPPPPMPPSPLESTMPVKRSPPEGDLPAPKRPSMSNKHLCHVCNKNFSSSSALQIHMRTHTGDKPFRCTVCQKAFTTKGNLKVHMGTHMWTNGASRRGRRMSLDLPPLPITPKDSEFLQRRPDLFYPYLPAPFLNGVQQKLNEISVIQSNNGLSGTHPVSAGKYAGLFGTIYGGGGSGGGFPMEKPPMAPSNGPLSDGKSVIPSGSMLFQTPSPSHSPGTPSSNTGNQNSASVPAWSGESIQHHFEREGPATRPENDSTPPTAARLPTASAPRGEGLAA